MDLKNINKNILIWCFFVFLGCLIVRVYTLSLKQDLHEDEALNMLLSNYSETFWTDLPEINKKFTGKELKQMTYWNNESLKDTLSDIKNLYIYARDDSHSDIYYILTRIAFANENEFSIKSTILRAGILNLILFSLSFFFMYKLLAILFKNNFKLVAFGLFVAFFNTAAISTTCYFRPYQLQQAAFILVTYYFVKLLLDEKTNIYKASFAISLAFLSGYYSLIYVSIFAVVLFIKNINKKLLFKIAGLSILFTTLFYPIYFFGIISYRATEILEISNRFLKNLYYSCINFPLIYLKYLFSLSLLIYLIYLMIKIYKKGLKTNDFSKLIPLIFWLNFLWSVIVILIAPYKLLRYIMPAFPLMALIIPYIINHFKKTMIPISVITLIFGLNYYFAIEFYKNPKIGKYIPFISKLDFLKNTQVDNFLFEENKLQTVYILKDKTNPTMGEILKISELLPYFENEQNYIFINPNTKIDDKQFYILVPKKPINKYFQLAQPYYENYTRLNFQNASESYACIELQK